MAKKRQIIAKVFLVFSVFMLCVGCQKLIEIIGSEIKRPTPTPTIIATTPTKTPTTKNRTPFKTTEGKILFSIKGIDRIPKITTIDPGSGSTKTHWDSDNIVLFVLEWEQLSRTMPILGVHIRGWNPEEAGIVVKWGTSSAYNDMIYREYGGAIELYCGGDHNPHKRWRLATDGVYELSWNLEGFQLTFPDGKKFYRAWHNEAGKVMAGMMGFGSFRTELKDRKNEPWVSWNHEQASRFGLQIELLDWAGKPAQDSVKPCDFR